MSCWQPRLPGKRPGKAEQPHPLEAVPLPEARPGRSLRLGPPAKTWPRRRSAAGPAKSRTARVLLLIPAAQAQLRPRGVASQGKSKVARVTLLMLTAWTQLRPRSAAGPRKRAMQWLMLRMEEVLGRVLVRRQQGEAARNPVRVQDRDRRLHWAQVIRLRQGLRVQMVQRPQQLRNQEEGPRNQCLQKWRQHEMYCSAVSTIGVAHKTVILTYGHAFQGCSCFCSCQCRPYCFDKVHQVYKVYCSLQH